MNGLFRSESEDPKRVRLATVPTSADQKKTKGTAVAEEETGHADRIDSE
jgi:hypothetical protein